MSLDLGGPAVEIAIALAFVFFLLSLVASAVMEGISALFKFRSKNLKKGLEGMLGDREAVRQIFSHPLVRADLDLDRSRDPSYISPQNFALAFRDTVDVSSVSTGLGRQLGALTGSQSAAMPEAPTLEKWFDDSMDRASGWYKRKTQAWTYGIAVVLAIALNVSALRIAEQLSAEPSVRAAVVAKAEAAAVNEGSAQDETEDGEAAAGESGAEKTPAEELKQAGEEMQTAVDDLAALHLPIFWATENKPEWSWGGMGTALAGWLITVFAISLGAPFWFDALSKLSNLRMTGKKPEESKPAQPGAG